MKIAPGLLLDLAEDLTSDSADVKPRIWGSPAAMHSMICGSEDIGYEQVAQPASHAIPCCCSGPAPSAHTYDQKGGHVSCTTNLWKRERNKPSFVHRWVGLVCRGKAKINGCCKIAPLRWPFKTAAKGNPCKAKSGYPATHLQ